MPIGDYRHRVIVQKPGPFTPNGDGGFDTSWVDLVPPTWHCSIDPATARDLERTAGGSVLSTASHILKGHYRPDITTASRILFGGRALSVTGVASPEERKITLELTCVEVVL